MEQSLVWGSFISLALLIEGRSGSELSKEKIGNQENTCTLEFAGSTLCQVSMRY